MEKGKIIDALDESVKRLKFKNCELETRLSNATPSAGARIQADTDRNESLIDTLNGDSTSLLLDEKAPTTCALGAKEAQSIHEKLKDAGTELRSDQMKMIGYYNQYNTARARLAALKAQE